MGFLKSNNPFRQQGHAPPSSSSGGVDDVPPPPGPPPSHGSSSQDYAPPPGPPPSHGPSSQQQQQQQDYAPPPGPPPSHGSDYAPPSGPPPPPPPSYSFTTTTTTSQQPPQPPPPQQHDWQSAVPDTDTFPPPPDLFSGLDRSPASNATEAAAEAGYKWCERYPLLVTPSPPVPTFPGGGAPQVVSSSTTRLIQPHSNTFVGKLERKQDGQGGGVWSLVTDKKGGDACVLGYPPAYLVQRDSPLLFSSSHGYKKTIYYEVKIIGGDSSSSHHHHFFGSKANNNKKGQIGLALGFAALPYPPFRMPGWHRGSLAVHGDDGNRFVNDSHGGKAFLEEPFAPGETVGIGMRFSCSSPAPSNSSGLPPSYSATGAAGRRIEAEVFFTRDGQVVDGWDVHEELDAKTDLPITGLEGYHDLAIAVGTYKNVAVDIVLDPARWLYRGA